MLALVCLFPVLFLCAEAPRTAKPTEYQLKAADLVAFGRFVDWSGRPKSAQDEAFEICVLGQDPFGPALDLAVKGENIAGAPVVARRLARAQEASSCRVLFIGSSEESQLDSVVSSLAAAPVLTVAEFPNFTRRGGMIQFVLDENRVRFEINLGAAKRAGLSLSSDMLKVARAVRRTP